MIYKIFLPLFSRDRFILALILFLGFLIYSHGLDWGLPSKTLSLTTYHPDEPFLFQSLENIYKTYKSGSSFQVTEIELHYGTFHFYLSGALLAGAHLLGFITIGTRDFLLQNLAQLDRMYLIIRFSSVLFGVGTILGIYALSKRLYGTTAAFWSAFFVACSPTMIDIFHLAKLDALLPLLVVLLLFWTLNFMDHPSDKNAWVCGILSGLLASTRYNCGIFILIPLSSVWLMGGRKANLRIIVPIISGALIAFLVTTPYAVLGFPTFLTGIKHMLSFVTNPGGYKESSFLGIFKIIFDLAPFGTSWPMAIFFLIGVVLSVKTGLNPKEKILAIGFISFFALICLSATRYTYYLTPILPIFSIFASVGLIRISEKTKIRFVKGILCTALVLYQIGYAWAYARLYAQPNPRELAGQWLLENVPLTESVGILRNYFWTPGILRQQPPHYPLFLKGGDDQSQLSEAVSGLQKMAPIPSYFILSEVEVRTLKGFSRVDPITFDLLQSFLKRYELVQVFENEPSLFGIPFWIRTPPMDMIRAAPTLRVYRKR